MSEKKNEQLGLRVPPEIKEDYKDFCEANGCSQGEGLGLLLQMQRMQEAEKANPKLAAILASGRHHAEGFMALLVACVDLVNDTKGMAREEFAIQLDQNAQLIYSLQEKVNAQEQELTDAREAKVAAEEELGHCLDRVAELEGRFTYAQTQLRDKDQRIQELMEDSDRTKDLPKRYQDLLEEANELHRKNTVLSDQLKDAEITHMRKVSELEKALHHAQLEVAKLQGPAEK